LPKLGHSGYKLAEALAEFIDNSLDAKDPNQTTVKVDIQISEKRIVIADDAQGMDEQIAINSLKLAHSNKKQKLGEFGLGLKTAATSLGKKFTIKTSQFNNKYWYLLDYDEEKWTENSNWKSQELKLVPKDDPQEKGTTIKIQDLKINYYPNLVTNTKKQLSFRFASYLENNILEIKVNTNPLKAPEVDIRGEKNEIEIFVNDTTKITGWYGFLKKRNGNHYGFNLYKHGRLIKAEEKFGFEPHSEVALLYGYLNLDHVPTTHNKREFIESSYEYRTSEEIIRKFLKENKITTQARELSKLNTEKKKKDKVEENMVSFFKAIKYLEEAKKRNEINKNSKIEIIEKEEIEKTKVLFNNKEFNLNSLEEGNFYQVDVLEQKYYFKFDLVSLGKENELVQYFKENHNVTILINTEFPFYEHVVKDYGLYSIILISEVIAKIIVEKLNYKQEDMLKIRNLLLRKYGEMQKEVIEMEQLEDENRKLLERIKKIEERKKSLSK